MKLKTMGFFDAWHYLPNDLGKCKNIHGHTFAYYIEIEQIQGFGSVEIDESGMLIDVGLVKELFDHTTLNNLIPNPTSENIALFIKNKVKEWLGINKDYFKIKVRVWEDISMLVDIEKLEKGYGKLIEV